MKWVVFIVVMMPGVLALSEDAAPSAAPQSAKAASKKSARHSPKASLPSIEELEAEEPARAVKPVPKPQAAKKEEAAAVSAKPANDTTEALKTTAEEGARPPELVDVISEVDSLRDEVARLQQTVDTLSNTVVRDLLTENSRLREEIRNAYRETGLRPPLVPTPNKELIEKALRGEENAAALPEGMEEAVGGPSPSRESSGEDAASTAPAEPAREATPAGPGAPAKYKVVAEWGRSPEEVAKLATKTSSLEGMICVVPPGAGDNSLAALGRALRQQAEGYDNINIEVFDDTGAALEYKETSVAKSGHRVLSVSKHQASGRDVILLIKGEATREVPLQE